MAAASPRVRLTVVGTREFPELARRWQVSVVPKVWVGGRIAIDGAPPERYLVEKMKEAGN